VKRHSLLITNPFKGLLCPTFFGAALLLGGMAELSSAAVLTNGFFHVGGTIYVTNLENVPVVTPAGICPANVRCILWQDPTGVVDQEVDISSAGLPNGDIPLSIFGNLAADMFNLEDPPNSVNPSGFPSQLFLQFNSPPVNPPVSTQLWIDLINPGSYSAALCAEDPARSNSVCTPVGSLFELRNAPPPLPGGTVCGNGCTASANWSFEGTLEGPGQPAGGTWVGAFSTTFQNGKTYQEIFTELSTAHFVKATFDGVMTLQTPQNVPEPAMFGMIGLLLVLVPMASKRYRKSRNADSKTL